MPNTIRHKRSGTASSIPTAGTLVAGELAVNTADGRVYTKRDSGTVVDVAQAILATGQTIVCALGSAGACGVAPVGDLHTGLFFGADIVNVSTGGTQRMQIDANGNVGIGNNALSSTRLTSAFTLTNATGFGMQCNTVATASTNGVYATFGAQIQVIHNIAAGVTNSNVSRAMLVQCVRNTNNSTDAGSLGFIRGMEFQYGHGNTNTGISPTTTQVIGLQFTPLAGPGTMTELYDIFVGTPAHGTGTIGNHFSIFQAAATAKNYFAGRVGCNTVNPATALDVVGQITVSAGTLALPSIVFANDANTGLFSSAADTINIVTAGVTRLTVGATGTVTTAGDHTVNGTLRATAGLQSTGARSLFRAVNEQYAVGSAYSATSGFVYFGARNESATPDAVISNAGGATLMTLQTGGNVGVGTTSPSQKLDVNGNVRVAGSISRTGASAATDLGLYSETASNWIRLSCNSGDIRFFVDAAVGNQFQGGTASAVLTSAGNFGIGTTTPGTKLQVDGVVSVPVGGTAAAPTIIPAGDTNTGIYYPTGGDIIALGTNGTERLRLNATGDVTCATGSTFKPSGITEGVVAIGNSGNSLTLSIANGTVLTCTLNPVFQAPLLFPTCTFTMPTATAGKRFTLILTQGGTQSKFSFPGVKWPANTEPAMTPWVGAPALVPKDILDFVADGTHWYGRITQNYLA